MRQNPLFPPYGTMLLRSLTLARHVAMPQALDAIAMNEMSRSRGLVFTRSPSQARAQNDEYVRAIGDLVGDTSTLWKSSIFIQHTIVKMYHTSSSDHVIFIGHDRDLHRTVATHRDFNTSRGRYVDTSGCISMR